mgnify:CR=1 FL=1
MGKALEAAGAPAKARARRAVETVQARLESRLHASEVARKQLAALVAQPPAYTPGPNPPAVRNAVVSLEPDPVTPGPADASLPTAPSPGMTPVNTGPRGRGVRWAIDW